LFLPSGRHAGGKIAARPLPLQLTAEARPGLDTHQIVPRGVAPGGGPAEEFAQGNLPGAANMPLERLETKLAELSTVRQFVAYHRNPWCVLSFEAVARLRAAGFDAYKMARTNDAEVV
jgi:rhodanese-related sulfurtransferase